MQNTNWKNSEARHAAKRLERIAGNLENAASVLAEEIEAMDAATAARAQYQINTLISALENLKANRNSGITNATLRAGLPNV